MIEIYTMNCSWETYHAKDRFINFRIYENNKEVTKDYYGKKPPVDESKIII